MSSLIRPIANRAIHLRITPRPSNLGESREIMRLMSQFGPIEHFKNLRYDTLSAPNAIVIIYTDESAAKECLKNSPIRFRMGRAQKPGPDEEEERRGTGKGFHEEALPSDPASQGVESRATRGPSGSAFGLAQTRGLSTSSLPKPPPRPIRMPFDRAPTPEPPRDDSRIFQIQTNPSTRRFRDLVNTSHYYGYFAIDTKMVGQEDLNRKVPLKGLSCVEWNAAEKPWAVARGERSKFSRSLGELWDDGRRETEGQTAVDVG